MNIELERKLFKEFPELFRYSDDIQASLTGFGVEYGDGWYDLTYNALSKIYKIAKRDGLFDKEYPLYLTQAKEKFGYLRLYFSFGTDEIWDIVEEAELKSMETCEICGNKGEIREDLSWILCLCDEHYDKQKSNN